jgi:hypothetical protein
VTPLVLFFLVVPLPAWDSAGAPPSLPPQPSPFPQPCPLYPAVFYNSVNLAVFLGRSQGSAGFSS